MYKETRLKIQHSAQLILGLYRDGYPIDSIDAPYSTAIRVLIALESGGFVEDLARTLDLNPNTVFEYINALEDGGVTIKKEPIKKKEHKFSDGHPRHFFSL